MLQVAASFEGDIPRGCMRLPPACDAAAHTDPAFLYVCLVDHTRREFHKFQLSEALHTALLLQLQSWAQFRKQSHYGSSAFAPAPTPSDHS